MKAAIAILTDVHVQNVARKMVYEIYRRGGIDFLGSLLPAHVSLKLPFTMEDMDVLEDWFESFSKRVAPFRIELERIYYDQWEDYAVVGFEVLETPTLRTLHNQINRELKELVRDPSAPHDGEDYHFHLTVELGNVAGENPFNKRVKHHEENPVFWNRRPGPDRRHLAVVLAPPRDSLSHLAGLDGGGG